MGITPKLELAARAAGLMGHSAPRELVESWLCQFYHCLPSQLEKEPADKLVELYLLEQAYQQGRSTRPQKL